jgi:RHS repeat-associated protein
MPRIYGHSYAYGNHRELVKAKYFTDETEKLAVPFQPDTLSRQTALNKQQSRDVWKQLDDAGFIVSDQRKSDWLTAVANPGKSFTRSDDLKTLLAAVTGTQEDVKLYRNLIEKMILKEIGQRRNKLSTLDEFQKIFLQWSGFDDGMPFADSEKLRRVAEKVHQVMGKAKDTTDWLDAKLRQIFNAPQYSKYLADFIRILDQHFTYALGEHPFDVASFDIDANGNHKKFYTGFHRYEFSYDDDKANRIRSIKVEEIGKLDVNTATDKTMLHDTRGNVIQALHKGIERIEYNDASMRTTAIHLTDGRTVRFAYDAHGERILKRVMAKDGHLIHEAHYARDTEGKVLFDRRTTYSSTSSSLLPELKDAAAVVVSTSYIYGPRGLLGFVRNGAFHSVWTDHSGSIRLVLRDGQVVAAYDYLPYGQLMRSYGNDPAAEIFYRYTGQEWDGETGLYNYHARFYDPDIGRFYQPDPREQYFSPYKYVGNSPVSLVDPDGEFGLLIGLLIGLFAVGGAYLGGAAANNNWNPGKWN